MRPKVRTVEPLREQGRIVFEVPETALGPGHRARLLWEALGLLDLSRLLAGAKSFEGSGGVGTV